MTHLGHMCYNVGGHVALIQLAYDASHKLAGVEEVRKGWRMPVKHTARSLVFLAGIVPYKAAKNVAGGGGCDKGAKAVWKGHHQALHCHLLHSPPYFRPDREILHDINMDIIQYSCVATWLNSCKPTLPPPTLNIVACSLFKLEHHKGVRLS
jgi:hypothetical protein